MPTLNRRDVDRLRRGEPEPWTNGEWLAVLLVPAVMVLGTVFVLVLSWLGEL